MSLCFILFNEAGLGLDTDDIAFYYFLLFGRFAKNYSERIITFRLDLSFFFIFLNSYASFLNLYRIYPCFYREESLLATCSASLIRSYPN